MTNKKMKKTLLLLGMVMTTLVSCQREGCTDPTAINYDQKAKKDDGNCVYDEPSGNTIKVGYITSDETWTSDQIYELAGKVVVGPGVTLTIMPGTIIKGQQGSGTLASALIVAQGGMINACGTPTQPIIFTSVLDNIELGQTSGTNLDESDNGMWGGLIICGEAPISAGNGDVISQIEGIPVTDSYGAFGGNNPADNSGSLCYISIRHSGALIGAGNEINGLTLGGVGNATYIDNIEIVGNLDDGVEFFGGTVNVTNIVVGFQGDDGIDIDMNYAGTVDNFIVVNSASSDEALEIDGPEGMTHTNGLFTLNNGTVYTFGGGTTSVDLKSKAQGTLNNVKLDLVKIRASYQNDCIDPKVDAFTHLTNANQTLTFNACEFNNIDVYTTSQNNAGTSSCTVSATDQLTAESSMTSTPAVGGSSTTFDWTWLNANGKL
jgi:hypothetical protein